MSYGTLPRQDAPRSGPRSVRWAVAATAAVAAGALGLVVTEQHARSSALASELDALQALHQSNSLMRTVGHVKVPAASAGVDQEADALIAAAAAKIERRALSGVGSSRSQLAAKGKQHKLQRLAEEGDEGESDRDPPAFYENYKPGDVGVAGISKWVPEDHPEGHKDCALHDIDCDEMWPWGKVRVTETGPPARQSILGDNMIGLDSGDDAIVPTEDSGLLPQAHPYVDQFDHWPEASKKNKDLLYGSARKVISAKYTGVGDTYVPVEQLEDPAIIERQVCVCVFACVRAWDARCLCVSFLKPVSLAIIDRSLPCLPHTPPRHRTGAGLLALSVLV